MKNMFLTKLVLISFVASLFVCCGSSVNNETKSKALPSSDFNISNKSILIFEEGWEEWGTIAIFNNKILYNNTSKVYNEEIMQSGHGDGTDSFLLTPEAFNYLEDFINKSNIQTKMGYWDTASSIYTLYIISVNDVKILQNNKYGTKKGYQGYTFYPDETIKYYMDMKAYLMKSVYNAEYEKLLQSIDKTVISNARRQKEVAVH